MKRCDISIKNSVDDDSIFERLMVYNWFEYQIYIYIYMNCVDSLHFLMPFESAYHGEKKH